VTAHRARRNRSLDEDFTEFEQRTTHFNGDPIRAAKKGMNIIMFDFPPAPKLLPTGRPDQSKATESERRGEQIFFGKGQCVRRPRARHELSRQEKADLVAYLGQL